MLHSSFRRLQLCNRWGTGLFADMPIRGQTTHGQDNSRTRLFTDMTIRRCANSWTRRFADMPIRGLWTIRGKTFRGQAGLFADKLFQVTALPVAPSQAESVKS